MKNLKESRLTNQVFDELGSKRYYSPKSKQWVFGEDRVKNAINKLTSAGMPKDVARKKVTQYLKNKGLIDKRARSRAAGEWLNSPPDDVQKAYEKMSDDHWKMVDKFYAAKRAKNPTTKKNFSKSAVKTAGALAALAAAGYGIKKIHDWRKKKKAEQKQKILERLKAIEKQK